ncbi:MAG: N-acetylmuramoyl-L-alanine amidase [Proteobacteria bacterium]|nr:N-acetylmuramoyl-L-alanine amidase [Pseudomonadota bacterium]
MTGCAASVGSKQPDGASVVKIVDRPSPNSAPRPDGTVIDTLVLHYTELALQESLDILSDGTREHRVSAHYVLAEDGTAYRLVPEERVAWHAGRSSWRGREALNGTSIGIEIVNLHGDRHDYPAQQIAALIELCRDVLARHPAIEPRNVVGHSDIAPTRKIDPGLRFPWKTLADAGIGLWPCAAEPIEGDVHPALRRLGYTADLPLGEIVATFQRRYRPARSDGVADRETRGLIAGLLDRMGRGA